MIEAAKEERLSPVAPTAWSGEEDFSLAAGVAVAPEAHLGANAAQDKKPHQGNFFKNRPLRVSLTWAKWSGTHQDSECWWSKIVSGSALDANGNTTSSAGISNTYDFENRMLTHGSLTLTYDGDGNRVSETIGGTTTKFLVDDKNPTGLPQVLDELVNSSVTRTYAYGLQRISENQLVNSSWTPSFYGHDGHGNVRFLSNTSAAVTDSYDYDAFGMPIRTSGTTPNQFLYSGERYDSSVGLYDLRARYLNQATGRFWARDPIEGSACFPLTYNPYIYVWDNAVNRIDPRGLASTTWPTARPAPGTEYLGLLALIASIAPHVQQLGRVIECKAEWTSSHFSSVFTTAINGGNPLKVKNVSACEDDLDDCTKRYLKEKAFCSANYWGTPLYGACRDRAFWRYSNCQKGVPDPGPLDPLDPDFAPD